MLITGVTWLVGYAAYTHLTGHPERYKVYELDRQRNLSARTLSTWRNKIFDERFLQYVLTDFDGIRDVVAGMDMALHWAADPKGNRLP